MSNAFTNFLGGVFTGVFGENADLKDYQHADRLFVKNTYARSPKFGFLFYVTFNINKNAILDETWQERRGNREVGLLVKSIDLPRFTMVNETLNQYNKKTIVHTKITYKDIQIEFHDDNSDITLDLWTNYFKYYIRDSRYGDLTNGKTTPIEYSDNKFGEKDFAYGLDNDQSIPFFESIDIYVLHKGKGQWDFTQFTLVNPKISDWSHDNLNYENSSKVLDNKMQVSYETVLYKKGKIVKNKSPEGFAPIYYDTTPSPLGISGGIPGTLFGANGVISGANTIFGENGTLASGNLLAAAIQTRNLSKGIGQLNKAGVVKEGYSILSSALSGIATAPRSQLIQPGGLGQAVQTGLAQTGQLGTIGVNLFQHKNESVNRTTKTTPINLLGGKT